MHTQVFDRERMQYETPPEGISIGGYIARRLHKTALLANVPALLQTAAAQALAQLALYAAAASTSFGPALYQPRGDAPGTQLLTVDPQTGAQVCVSNEGDLRFSYSVSYAGVGTLTGAETITGTTVGLRGLGMPAPSTFAFVSADGNYRAQLGGTITSELAPRIGAWRIRGYGSLDLSDSAGNHGRLVLDRAGRVTIEIQPTTGAGLRRQESLTA
jgi:hypothetical protein